VQGKPNQSAERRVKTRYAGVYKSVSGRYEVAFRDSDGRLRFKTVGPNLQEAVAARADLVGKVRKGGPVRPSRVTFSDYADSWLAGLSKRPRTIETYRYHLNAQLRPRFGNRKLADITTDDCARLVADLTREGLAAYTVRGALRVLSGIMRRAAREGLIAANPVSRLEAGERPALSEKQRRILEPDELGRLIDAADGQWRPLVAVLAFAGTRIGEALALRWEDVDFDGGFLRIGAQLSRGSARERIEAKTRSGVREVLLVPQLAKLLKAHKLASPHSATGDYLFPAPGGRGTDQRIAARAVKAAVNKAELGDGITAHTLRHGFGSMLIRLGLDPVTVSKQMGHKNANVTLGIYAHEFEKQRTADDTRTRLADGFGHLLAARS